MASVASHTTPWNDEPFGTDVTSQFRANNATSDTDDRHVGPSSKENSVISRPVAAAGKSEWIQVPSHNSTYLATVSEYVKPPNSSGMKVDTSLIKDLDEKVAGGWNTEVYENSLDVDRLFERFVERVSNEYEQCVR